MVLLVILLASCGWERKLSFERHDRSASVEFMQPFPANGWGLEVRLITSSGQQTLYRIRGDVFLEFAQVYWSSDNKTVGIFTCGSPALKLAYEMPTHAKVPFSSIEKEMRATIEKTYERRDRSIGALEWACSIEGKDAFYRQYPGAVPR